MRYRLSPLPMRSLVTLALLAAVPAVSAAQVVTRPPRGFRGVFGGSTTIDPNRPRQDLVFTLNATGGVDDNAAAGEVVGPPVIGQSDEPGYTGQVDLGLNFSRTSQQRTVGFSTWGSATTYRNVSLPSSRSAGVGFNAQSEVSRRMTLGGSARLSYRSQLPLDTALDIGEPDPVPTSPSINGLYDSGSFLTTLSGNLDRRWTRRSTSTVSYSYATTQFIENNDGDMRDHRVVASLARQLSQATALSAVYEYGNTRIGLGDNDPGRPLNEHRVSGGATYQKRLSATRLLDLGFQGGALRVESVGATTLDAYNVWAPFAEATARVGVSRSWSLDGAYRRSTQSMAGFANPETYITDTVTGSLGGLLAPRLDLVLSASFAKGTIGLSEVSDSEYLTSGASAQIRVAVTRSLAAVAGYHYYRYRFTDTVLPVGLPSEFDRSAVRVGLTLWLPLYGGYTDRPR